MFVFQFVLVLVALGFYARRYAYSGADNARYYFVLQRFMPRDVYTRIQLKEDLDRVLPDIHVAENRQQWSAHASWAALTLAIEPSLAVGWLWAAALGASWMGSFYFNRYIWRGRPEQLREGRKEQKEWWPLRQLELFFMRHRGVQWILGAGIVAGSMAAWAIWH